MSEKNKAIARRLVDEMWTKAKVEVLDEIATPDVVHHDNKASRPGKEWKPYIAKAHAAFPGWQFTIEDMFAEGDKVCIRWLWRATLRTEFGPYKPTGVEITAPGMSILRFAGGKIAEVWTTWDTATMKA